MIISQGFTVRKVKVVQCLDCGIAMVLSEPSQVLCNHCACSLLGLLKLQRLGISTLSDVRVL